MDDGEPRTPVGSAGAGNRAQLLIWLVIVVVIAAGAFYSYNNSPVSAPERATIGKRVPDLQMTLLNGKKVGLASLQQKPFVVYFWASWCGPCVRDFPRIETALRQRRELEVIGVVFNDVPARARTFIGQHNPSWESALDEDKKVAGAFGVSVPPGIPQWFFINKSGVLTSRLYGEVSDEKLAAELDKITPKKT